MDPQNHICLWPCYGPVLSRFLQKLVNLRDFRALHNSFAKEPDRKRQKYSLKLAAIIKRYINARYLD